MLNFVELVESLLSKIVVVPFNIDDPFMGGNKREDSWMVPGVWLDRSGNVIPINTEHSEAIKKIFNLDVNLEPTKALRIGYNKGWARVTINPHNKEVAVVTGGKLTPSQKRNLKNWTEINGYKLSHYPRYSD